LGRPLFELGALTALFRLGLFLAVLAEVVLRLGSLIGECCLKYAKRNLRVIEVKYG